MAKAGIGIVEVVLVDVAFVRGCNCSNRCCMLLAKATLFTNVCLRFGVTRVFRKRGLPCPSVGNATKTLSFSVPRPHFLPAIEPPKYASSNLITPCSSGVSFRCPIAVQMYLSMDQAVLRVRSKRCRQLNG